MSSDNAHRLKSPSRVCSPSVPFAFGVEKNVFETLSSLWLIEVCVDSSEVHAHCAGGRCAGESLHAVSPPSFAAGHVHPARVSIASPLSQTPLALGLGSKLRNLCWFRKRRIKTSQTSPIMEEGSFCFPNSPDTAVLRWKGSQCWGLALCDLHAVAKCALCHWTARLVQLTKDCHSHSHASLVASPPPNKATHAQLFVKWFFSSNKVVDGNSRFSTRRERERERGRGGADRQAETEIRKKRNERKKYRKDRLRGFASN